MKPRTKLYEVVKRELKARGNWKDKARGVAFKKGVDPRRVKLVKSTEPLTGTEAVAAARLMRLRRNKLDKQG